MIAARIAEILEELIAPLADPETLVFAADEVPNDQETVVRRASYRKNSNMVLKADKKKPPQLFYWVLEPEHRRMREHTVD